MALINTTLTQRNLTVASLTTSNYILTLTTTGNHDLGGITPIMISGATGANAFLFNGTFNFTRTSPTTLTAQNIYPTTAMATGTITAAIDNLQSSTIVGDGGVYFLTVADGFVEGGATLTIQTFNPDQSSDLPSTESVGDFIEPIIINNGNKVSFVAENATGTTNFYINVSR